MYEVILVKCIRCGAEKPFNEYDRYTRDKRYKFCRDCQRKDEIKAEAQRKKEKIPEWVSPKTANSWPFYGSGDKFVVKPPSPYYKQIQKHVGKIRSGYKLLKMTKERYILLHELFTKYNLMDVPFPARLNKIGLAVWDDKLENSSVTVLYTLGFYITHKKWNEMCEIRLEKIRTNKIRITKKRELRAAVANAFKLSCMDNKTKEIIKRATTEQGVERIVKVRQAQIEAFKTPGLEEEVKDAIIGAKTDREVKMILKVRLAKLEALDILGLPKQMREDIKNAKTEADVKQIVREKKEEQKAKEKEKADAKREVEDAQKAAIKKQIAIDKKAAIKERIVLRKKIAAEKKAEAKKKATAKKKAAAKKNPKKRGRPKKEKKL